MPRMPVLRRVCWFVCLGWLAGCASIFGPRTVEVPQAQLQQWIERQFPIDNRVLELLDVSLGVPRLTLRPDTNRIATRFEVNVSDRIFRVPHHGSLVLSHGVRFDPIDNTVRLADVRIESVEFDGAPALAQRQFDRVAVQLAERMLSDRAIYTLRPKDIEAVQGRGYRPGDIRVTPTGLSITLLPSEPR